MTKVIFLNGPAGSGKDTVGAALADALENETSCARVIKFAETIKSLAAKMLGFGAYSINYFKFFETAEGKATKIPGLDITHRQFLIKISEEWMKPLFGNNVFGKLTAKTVVQSGYDFIVITDCGFRDEIFPVVEKVGVENCFVFRLQREGTTFEGDSRGYIYFEDIFNKDLDNNRPVEEAVGDILREVL